MMAISFCRSRRGSLFILRILPWLLAVGSGVGLLFLMEAVEILLLSLLLLLGREGAGVVIPPASYSV